MPRRSFAMHAAACCLGLAFLLGAADGRPANPGQMDLGDLLGGLAGMGGAAGGAKGKQERTVCPKGKFQVPRPLNRLKKGMLIANGCGPQGMQMQEPFGLWRCCNRHDVCFSSCNTTFEFCERKFEQCMKNRCKEPENVKSQDECMKSANSFSSMTKMFGKGSHSSTMFEVCDCADTEKEAWQKRRDWVLDVYTRFGPAEKASNETFIDEVLKKHKGKEGTLYFDLIIKYGGAKGFVEFDNVANTFELSGPSEVAKGGGDEL
eukprot:TRINITY_DN22465_c0_g1_i2.p1 TRINITY_DN22465_c0_g1~~TRINITY_DN22465_c0_g1_i2.p1  ORF type:complete len:262 (-),score=72.18 TRINITY_DN22465_c0_g1_i2:29-814(-)